MNHSFKRNLIERRGLWFALFVALAFALQSTTFGDVNRHVDETFYFLVGQRMHEGLLPYVDVWDRKPLGLFLIYYLIAGISHSVLAYQIVASLFAAATALVIALLTARWSNARGGLLAGACYLVIVGPFEGNTGQAPDFYNLFVAVAALLVVKSWPALDAGRTGWRIWAAMALCGIAITIKHTALFESAFLGLAVIWALYRSGATWPRLVAVAATGAAIGAAPTLAIAGYFAALGHWAEFWHAMVVSNLAKAPHGGAGSRLVAILMRLLVALPFMLFGLAKADIDPRARRFVFGWLLAAAIGLASMRNFYGHYTLALLVPVAIGCGFFLSRRTWWAPLFALFVLYVALWQKIDQREWTRGSNASMAALSDAIRTHDGGGGLLLYDAPVYLYALTGKAFLSPLVFPHHLNHAIERNVSHLDTRREVERIIAAAPGVIVLSRWPRNYPVNHQTRAVVLRYARAHCPYVREIVLHEERDAIRTIVFGDCRAAGSTAGR